MRVFRFSWKMTVLKIIYAHEKRSCHEQTTPSSHRRAKSRAVTPARSGKKPVSEVCNEASIQPSLFYTWQRELLAGAHTVFSSRRAPSREKELEEKISRLEARVAHKDHVIAEVTEEYVTLKKKLGEA